MSARPAMAAPALQMQRMLPLLLLLGGIVALFWPTAVEMVDTWHRSVTYNHAFLVPLISMWLIWRQRQVLRGLPVRAEPWMLLPMALACVLWLLGDLASVNAAAQFALVSLLVLAVPALLGLAVTRALLFPLLFLYFSVPFGSFLVPTLMDHTADFTVLALRASGVPVYREGLQFVIPSGSWSVVEACSGIRYLIASFMVGTLYAYLNYRSTKRRAIFMLVSLLVPVVANWLRAYLIVMLGHLSNNELAAGVDHLIYGWVFFGVIIGLMFFIGARWAEPDPVHEPAAEGVAAAASEAPLRSWLTAVGISLLLLGTHAVVWALEQPQGRPLGRLELPANPGGGWQVLEAPLTDWVPDYHAHRLTAGRSYTRGDARGGVWVAYYRDQGRDGKMISSLHTLTAPKGTHWSEVGSGRGEHVFAGRPVGWRTAELRGSVHADALAAQRLRVWQTFWVGGRLIDSPARAKLQLALHRLQGGGDDSAVLIFYAPQDAQADNAAVQAVLGSLVDATLPDLLRELQALAGQPAAAGNAAAALPSEAPAPRAAGG